MACSYWERDDVVGVSVTGNELHVMHKRYRGYTPFSLNIHGGSPKTQETDVFSSSWRILDNEGKYIFNKINDWQKITSVSGHWYPNVYKAPNKDVYVAYHNISMDEKYLNRYTVSESETDASKFDIKCNDTISYPCFALDRYSTRFFSDGSIYNVSDFSLYKTLNGNKGYDKFISLISSHKSLFPVKLVKLSTDGKYLFYTSSCRKQGLIYTYNVTNDIADSINTKKLNINCDKQDSIKDIDSYGESIQIVVEKYSPKSNFCCNENREHKKPKYSIYDVSAEKWYSLNIDGLYYGISEGFWDIKNQSLYVLVGNRVDDIDKLEIFNYANDSNYSSFSLKLLIH